MDDEAIASRRGRFGHSKAATDQGVPTRSSATNCERGRMDDDASESQRGACSFNIKDHAHERFAMCMATNSLILRIEADDIDASR